MLFLGHFSWQLVLNVADRWQAKPVTIDDDVSLAQFHLADWTYQENMGISTRRTRLGFFRTSRKGRHFELNLIAFFVNFILGKVSAMTQQYRSTSSLSGKQESFCDI